MSRQQLLTRYELLRPEQFFRLGQRAVQLTSQYNLAGGKLNAGTFTLSGGQFNFTGGTLHVDTFDGDLTQDGGTFLVGGVDDTSIAVIFGDYALNAGTLAVELASSGGLPGGSFDHLIVNDVATIDPATVLDVGLIAGFTPSLGETFGLISANGGVSGQFGGVNGSPGGRLAYELVYGANNIVLLVTSDLAGDYNNDGTVDAADYTVWRDNEGMPAGSLVNDTDGGVIGAAQYDTWVANFGGTIPSATTVPEPGAATLLLGALLVRLRRPSSSVE